MTKMTVLHFASPFAFSMPAPLPPAPPPVRETGAALEGAEATRAFSRPNETDGRPPSSGADLFLADFTAATEGAGFETSIYDTVIRRYGEQQSSPAETDPPAPDDPEAS